MSVNVPIKTVTPANANGTAIGQPVTNLPAPVSSDWVKSDFSAPDAGRLESGRMLKKRKGKADKLEIEWAMLTRAETALVLQTFDHEYFLVEYLDAKAGTWVIKCFYAGDHAATGWLPQVDRWKSVKVPIIRAIPDPG